MAKAASFGNDMDKVRELRELLREGILEIESAKINCYNYGNSAPHILSVTFDNVRGEVLMHTLEEKGIFVSTGSACHSNKFGESHVLSAIGLNKNEIGGTIRFSIGSLNTKEDIRYCIEVLKEEFNNI